MRIMRSRYLKEMGIDVWTSRSSVVSFGSAAPTFETTSQSSTLIKDPDLSFEPRKNEGLVQEPKELSDGQVPKFMFGLFHYETVGICISLPSERDLHRSFCDDVARAMGGNIESVRYQLLKWPLASASDIDQSISAAREVVAQKFRQMPPKLLVFGDDVRRYYSPLLDLAPFSAETYGRQSLMMVPSIKNLLSSSSSKRQLMLALCGWCSSKLY